jgi:hypothetical protein
MGREMIAHHEAGHCVACYKLRIPFRGRPSVSIIASEDYEGYVARKNILKGRNLECDTSGWTRLKMERVVEVHLSGIEAQRLYDPSSVDYGKEYGDWDGWYDYHQAVELIGYFTSGSREAEAYLELLRIRAELLVSNDCNRKCIEAIAAALLERNSLSGREAVKIIEATITSSVKLPPALESAP